MLLSRVLWPDKPHAMAPDASLLPWFIGLSILESASFGIGVATLIVYWREGSRYFWPFISLIWWLVSWWPHDNFHRTAEEHNLVNLLSIEYAFHLTLIIASFILARFMVKNIFLNNKKNK
jgi:hypothetical protein